MSEIIVGDDNTHAEVMLSPVMACGYSDAHLLRLCSDLERYPDVLNFYSAFILTIDLSRFYLSKLLTHMSRMLGNIDRTSSRLGRPKYDAHIYTSTKNPKVYFSVSLVWSFHPLQSKFKFRVDILLSPPVVHHPSCFRTTGPSGCHHPPSICFFVNCSYFSAFAGNVSQRVFKEIYGSRITCFRGIA